MFAALASHPWAFPALEVVHIIGIALLLGNLVLLELRVLGVAAALPLGELARLSVAVACAGFALAAASGLLMFSTAPQELLANRAFTLKMLLLLAAGSNAAAFHARGSLQRIDTIGRVQMIVSLLIWLAVVTCGRWIAYQ